MPLIRHVTTDAAGAPGVYIRERQPSPITRGINRNKIGLAGTAIRGPANVAVEVASPRRFAEVFGGRDQGGGGAIASELWKALLGKPFGPLTVVRVVPAAAATASFNVESAAGGGGTEIAKIAATSPGTWGNNVGWKVSAATDGNANHWNLTLRYLNTYVTYQNLDTSTGQDNTAIVLGSDYANLVVITKLANGRPANSAASTDGADADGYTLLGQTVGGYTAVAGTDGTLADTDYTGTGKAMEILNARVDLAACAVAGRSNSTIKTKAYALAPTCRGLWLIGPDSSSVTYSTFGTEVANYRHGRVIPCFNAPSYTDPTTDELVVGEPHIAMASMLSQIEEDSHPGAAANAVHNAGIRGLAFENLIAADYDAIDALGISYLERDIGPAGQVQFTWGNAVTASLAENDRQLTGRRAKDFLIAGIAQRLKADVFEPNTRSRRESTRSSVLSWLQGLAIEERFIATDESSKQPLVTVENGVEVNSSEDRRVGNQRTQVRAQLIPHQLRVGLDIEVGTDVTITELAA